MIDEETRGRSAKVFLDFNARNRRRAWLLSWEARLMLVLLAAILVVTIVGATAQSAWLSPGLTY